MKKCSLLYLTLLYIAPTASYKTLAVVQEGSSGLCKPIDFETVPGSVPSDELTISTQYLATEGIRAGDPK